MILAQPKSTTFHYFCGQGLEASNSAEDKQAVGVMKIMSRPGLQRHAWKQYHDEDTANVRDAACTAALMATVEYFSRASWLWSMHSSWKWCCNHVRHAHRQHWHSMTWLQSCPGLQGSSPARASLLSCEPAHHMLALPLCAGCRLGCAATPHDA